MELFKDKNGASLSLIAGSWVLGRERIFQVVSATRSGGIKIEYELKEILFPDGTFQTMIENPDFFQRMLRSCSYRLIELPAAVISEQFEKGLLIHF